MNYGSVCSGIEAATTAWRALGWKAKFFAEVEPFPAAVLCHRYGATRPLRPLDPAGAADEKDRALRESWARQLPALPDGGSIPNLGDFTKIQKEDYEGDIDLLVGGTPCFPAGNMVLTERGYVPIEDIRTGDMVMTHRGRLRRVLATGSKVAANVGVCRVVGRPAFRVTDNHPFLTARGWRNHSRKSPDYARLRMAEPDFQPIGKSQGDFAGYLNTREHPCNVPMPELPAVYDADRTKILELCGWYLGDGYIRNFRDCVKRNVLLCLSQKKLDVFERHFKGIVHYTPLKPDNNGVSKVQISCTQLANFLEDWFGHLAQNKRIPAWIYGLSGSDRDAFLDGYRLTDGSRDGNIIGFTTTSRALAYGIADVCSFASIVYVDAPPTTRICGRTVNQRPWFRVSSYPVETSRKFHRFGRWLFGRIRKYELQEKPETVYNLEVEDDNSYVCNGLCVHNCQSYSIAGLRKGLSDPRGNLALEFVRLAYRSDARWTVWENVPGVLSSGAGGDFASFLSLLCGWEVPVPKDGWGKCGIVTNAPGCYGLAWRILDAQYTRVPMFPRAIPQRRRRLFVVGYRGGPVGSPLDWTHPAAVLLDGEMREGDTPPRRETASGASPASPGGAEEAGKRGVTDEPPETLRMREGCSGGGKGPLISKNVSLTLATANDQTLFEKKAVWWDGSEKADTLTCTSNAQLMPDKKRLQCVVDMRAEEPVCFAQNQRDELRLQGGDGQVAGSVCSMRATKQQNFIAYENHGNDSRVTEAGDVSPTLTSRMGTGGNNQPFVQKVNGNESVPVGKPLAFIKNDAGGVQDGYWEDVFPTMRCEITPAVARRECFSISPCDANGTRADRPDGGLYVTPAEASKTLTRGNPNTETVVVEPPVISLDGDKMGKADRAGGSGLGVNTDDVMYTQTVKDVHAVAYAEKEIGCDIYNGKETGEVSATVSACSCATPTRNGPPVVKVDSVVDMMAGKSGCHVSREDISPTLATTHGESHAVAYGGNDVPAPTETANPGGIGWQATVRRLLPVETERLMGFPDDFTRIPWKGKPAGECPDAPRYKACGNSMCVNVMNWIGLRIDAEERRIQDERDREPEEHS